MENLNNSNSHPVLGNFSFSASENFHIRSMTKQNADPSIFTDDDLLVLDKTGKTEPDWKYMFFDWMSDSMRKIYFSKLTKIYNQCNLFFIKGLQSEYCEDDISDKRFRKALDYYLLGAKMNNQHCLFKLFYILKDDFLSKKFGLKKSVDLSIYYLIKASSYNESFLDINKIDPIIKLMHIVYYKDRDLNRIRKLLEKMKYVNNELNVLIDDLEFKYLFNFLRLNFCNRDYEFKEALYNLDAILDSHPEACYKLACLYYNPIHKEVCPRNVVKSVSLFKSLYDKHYTKSYSSYYKICEELKYFDRVEDVLLKSKKLKNYSSQFYANFLSKNKDEINLHSEKIFKNFFFSILYGNLIGIVICFEIITQIFLKNAANVNVGNYKLYLQIIYDFVSVKKDDPYLNKLLDYDILVLFHQIHASYHYKGILVKKDLRKSIELLERTFKDKRSLKNYRKVFYYLGKAYRKLGDHSKSNFYLKYTFDIYIMLKEFPYHHYVVAKLFLRGIPGVLEKSIENAHYFLNIGAGYTDNYYFINSFYSKKCSDCLLENSEIQDLVTRNETSLLRKFSLDSYIEEKDICIVCYSNFKQIIFVKCGHKCLCYLCFEKLNKSDITFLKPNTTWKCPMCQQESSRYINSFDMDLCDKFK